MITVSVIAVLILLVVLAVLRSIDNYTTRLRTADWFASVSPPTDGVINGLRWSVMAVEEDISGHGDVVLKNLKVFVFDNDQPVYEHDFVMKEPGVAAYVKEIVTAIERAEDIISYSRASESVGRYRLNPDDVENEIGATISDAKRLAGDVERWAIEETLKEFGNVPTE